MCRRLGGRRFQPKTAVKIVRYGIYWVSLDPTIGREQQKTRPCVVVSPEAMHQTTMAVVCPLTRKLHPSWAPCLQLVWPREQSGIKDKPIRGVMLAHFRR